MSTPPDAPGRSGLGPEESDTPPGDIPDLPDIPNEGDLPDDDGLLEPADE